MIESSLLLSISTFAFLLGFIFYLSGVVFLQKSLLRWGSISAWIVLIILSAGILMRWIESYQLGYGRAPLSNLYESLVFAAWSITLIYLLLEMRHQHKALGLFPMLFSFLAMAYASFSPGMDSVIRPLVPALKSNWLIIHVVTCFFGYAAFTVSFGISIVHLWKSKQKINPHPKGIVALLPSLNKMDELNYQMVFFGFIWLSLGIISGSVWANSAWGTYWSWDPKETWSLITWLIYAAILHARNMKGWRGNRVAWLSLVGFGCVLFTYFGVNFLLSGLHSYGQL